MKVIVALALVALVGCVVEARTLHTRALKDTLIAKGNSLLKQADAAIVKLEAEHKATSAHEITVVKTEEAKIKQLIADLEAATDDAKITSIEHQLTLAEHALQFELAKINHTVILPVPHPVDPIIKVPVVTRDLKDTLITRGNDLVKQADAAIKKLEADKKTHEVTVIKAEEARIQKLVADLTAATEQTQIAHLERELGALEARLAHELNRINHTGPVVGPGPVIVDPIHIPIARDLKDDLTKKGEALLKKTDAEIKKLDATAQAHEITILKTEEAKIKKLVAELAATTDEAKLKTVEHNLSTAENKLSTELAKIAHGTGTKTTKPPTTTASA